VIPAEQARKYLLLLENASQSKLVLSEYQKKNRVMEIYQQAVRELFDPPQRLLFRRRLEENAYILWKKEQAQEARVCLASALRLEEAGGILAVPSFLVELVKRSVYFLLEDEKEKKKEGTDLIIRP
ncbi:MAG: hypothetical protein NTY64_20445, partial [Deltaproteobacteria bacterium]|nr:hypothetical protein [Deltaproteobacteria bacterium]